MKLPAGLTDKNIELFENQGKAFAFFDGKIVHFKDLPDDILRLIRDEMLCNSDAVICLRKMGFSDVMNMLEQYIICRYGALDPTPDFDTSSKNFTTEYHDCGKRGSCPFEFILCDKVRVGDVYLTRKQIEVVKLVAQGLSGKIVADKLTISIETFHNHVRNIYTKLGINTNTELTAFAFRHNLIK